MYLDGGDQYVCDGKFSNCLKDERKKMVKIRVVEMAQWVKCLVWYMRS